MLLPFQLQQARPTFSLSATSVFLDSKVLYKHFLIQRCFSFEISSRSPDILFPNSFFTTTCATCIFAIFPGAHICLPLLFSLSLPNYPEGEVFRTLVPMKFSITAANYNNTSAACSPNRSSLLPASPVPTFSNSSQTVNFWF